MTDILSAVLAIFGVLVLPAVMLWGLQGQKFETHKSQSRNGDITELTHKLKLLSLRAQSKKRP